MDCAGTIHIVVGDADTCCCGEKTIHIASGGDDSWEVTAAKNDWHHEDDCNHDACHDECYSYNDMYEKANTMLRNIARKVEEFDIRDY